MDDIPDFGDLAGLTRHYWLAVQRIRASDLADDGGTLILDEIEAQFRAARAASAAVAASASGQGGT
jgi:hypothetical protein